MRSMFPPPPAIAAATAPKSSGPILIPITVTTFICFAGVGVGSTISKSRWSPFSQPK